MSVIDFGALNVRMKTVEVHDKNIFLMKGFGAVGCSANSSNYPRPPSMPRKQQAGHLRLSGAAFPLFFFNQHSSSNFFLIFKLQST
jgi:hypothetical protein